MKFLKYLTTDLLESDDLDALPPDVIDELKKNIRDGARANEEHWSNALQLCHVAFRVSGIERPTPDLRNAWKQYEELLTYAVQQLAKYRGLDSDWRTTVKMYTEGALQAKQKTFRVTYSGPNSGEGSTVAADSIDDVIDELTHSDHGYDSKVHKTANEAHITFSKWGIKKGGTVTIRRVV